MTDVLVNPAAVLLGTHNAVLTGRGVTRHTAHFTGPLSIKGVMAGSATWETAAGRYELVPGTVLLLNDGEEYTLTIDSLQPVETFNFFFERGFVEDAYRVTMSSSAALLDAPPPAPMRFAERLHFDVPLVAELQRAHARLKNGEPLAESFYAAALQLAQTQADVSARIARLPALRSSTREELARRVGIATSFLHANLERRVTIAEAAREACLSPFHFHRLFTAFHDVTPHRYVTQLRLKRAQALLRTTTRDILDIALGCGFESLGSFTSLFTRTFGTPPARFRKNEEARADALTLRCAYERADGRDQGRGSGEGGDAPRK
ncbi:MAG: AraC family transcriptional regulator [Acidobacteriota bacterium]|nr:AraC family transcriptional regulator [Acidobacteriota bacterium]